MVEQHNAYLQRINLVMNYIRENLTEDLSVNALAQVACFSPFHFHRIFTMLVGETVNQCVNRLRMERAAALLRASPQMSILQAALDCGFNSASTFSRMFKKHYGHSPRSWNRQAPLKDSKNDQVFEAFPEYTGAMLSDVDKQVEFAVNVRSLPAQTIAYLRVVNSYVPERTMQGYQRLIDWYCARGGDFAQTRLYGMSQDDPDVTDLALCCFDWCLTVPADWQGEGEISTRFFPACEIAYIYCPGDIFQVDRAWQYLFRYWLPRSRYQPDNLPAMEIYHRQPAEMGWLTYDLECAIPIIAL